MPLKFFRPLLFAVFLVFVGGSLFSLRAGPGDACSLVTQAQAHDVLGVAVGAGQHTVSNDPLGCSWTETNATPATLKRAGVAIITVDSFTSEKAPVEGMTRTPLAGIGDDAYYVTAVIEGTTLYVKKGSQALTVSVDGHAFSTDQIKAMEKTLAQEALAKL